MQKSHALKLASGIVMSSSMLLMSLLPVGSALAATAPTVTSVKLGAEQGAVAVGNTVSFTATATQNGSGSPMYQFWYQGVNGNWHGTTWSQSNTFSLPALQKGSYEVVVYSKDKGQTTSVNSESTMSNQFVNVDSTLAISTNANDVAPNSTVTITANSTYLTDPVYQYWIGTPNGNGGFNWKANGNYTTSTTYSFHPPASGKYNIAVYAKDLNAPQDAQFALFKQTWETVYAQAAGVTLSPSSSTMAADGAATETVTATVVDKNGNIVGNYNGPVGVVVNPNQFVNGAASMSILPTGATNQNTANNTAANPYWFTAKNGVASINLAEIMPSNNVTGGIPTGFVGDTASVVPILPHMSLETNNAAAIKLVAPQPTYDIMAAVAESGGSGTVLTPLSAISAITNQSGSLNIAPVVADQNQVPMNGSTGIGDGGTAMVSVSGPATLTYINANGTKETNLSSMTMPIDAYNLPLDSLLLVPNPGQTGTITVSISNATNGLQLAAPVQIQLVPPENPASWQGPSSLSYTADQVAADSYAQKNLSESQNIWTAAGSTTSTTFGIQAVDQNGISVGAQMPSVNVTTAGGQGVADLSASIQGTASTGSYGVTLTYNGNGLAAGTYDVTISEGLMQTLVVPVTITTGVRWQVGVNPPSSTSTGGANILDVTPNNPSLTITGQIEDVLGNAVAAANGTALTFTDTRAADLQLSGGTGSASQQTVYVNGSGAASVNALALAMGDDGHVNVTVVLPQGASLHQTTAASASIRETNNLVSKLTASTVNSGYVAGTAANSGSYPGVLVTEERASGAPILHIGDTLGYSITSTNPFYPGANGTVDYSGKNSLVPVVSNMAGTYTVTVWDASNSAVAPVTAQLTIAANSAAGVGLFANGGEVSQDVPNALNMVTSTNTGVGNTGTIQATNNSPIPVWVHVTDATGNIVNAPSGGVTVNLSTGGNPGAAFENASGTPVTQVSIAGGQNGTEVWLVASQSGPVTVSATYAQAATVTFAGTNNGVARYYKNWYSWNVNVMDQFGNPITGLTSNDASVIDSSASPEIFWPSKNHTVKLVPVSGSPGEYTLSVSAAPRIVTTDVAQITIDGGSVSGTF